MVLDNVVKVMEELVTGGGGDGFFSLGMLFKVMM